MQAEIMQANATLKKDMPRLGCFEMLSKLEARMTFSVLTHTQIDLRTILAIVSKYIDADC